MIFKNVEEILKTKVLSWDKDKIIIKDTKLFREKTIDDIIDTLILSDDVNLKAFCYWISYEAAISFGVIPASTLGIYQAWGKGLITGFTIPAINLRVLTFDTARSVFRAAKKIKAAAFILEIADWEIEYTNQNPLEYSSVVMLAAIKEGYQGPLFLQGDHYQLNRDNFYRNKEKELDSIKNLIRDSINASIYNIDIDSSTLVDISKTVIAQQQKDNYEICAYFIKYIRTLEPKSIEISIGGEIGEIDNKNSTSEQLHVFIRGIKQEIKDLKGISKLSVQTGATCGGIVLPDGSIAKINIDFDTLKNLSEIARKEYEIAGCVQQGASTLPKEEFHHFPGLAVEIHLATQFQNLIYDYLPLGLKDEIYTWIEENCQAQNQPDWTRGQFIYNLRKIALGPFKREIHSLAWDVRNKIASVLEKEISFLFEQLRIKDTKDLVNKYTNLVKIVKTKEDFGIKD